MENASKALIMAAGVLISLIIVGALVLTYNNLSSYQKVGQQNTKEAQVVEFNNQYETFNRNNVRGSDLYSLLNKVVDYNRRKSSKGTGKDQGQYLAYEPMTITFDLDEKIDKFYVNERTTTVNHIIRHNTYMQSETKNDFEDEIRDSVRDLENQYGADSLTNLTTGLTKIFITNNEANNSEKKKQEAIANFNSASRKQRITTWDEIKEGSQIRKDVYQYYEYVQFKRARFNCEKNSINPTTNVKYNEKTGRIVEMNFKFTGKFE